METPDKGRAAVEFGYGDPLAGLVRLFDRSWTNDDGRHAGNTIEQTRFPTEGDFAVPVRSDKLLGERCDGSVGISFGSPSGLEHHGRMTRTLFEAFGTPAHAPRRRSTRRACARTRSRGI